MSTIIMLLLNTTTVQFAYCFITKHAESFDMMVQMSQHNNPALMSIQSKQKNWSEICTMCILFGYNVQN